MYQLQVLSGTFKTELVCIVLHKRIGGFCTCLTFVEKCIAIQTTDEIINHSIGVEKINSNCCNMQKVM